MDRVDITLTLNLPEELVQQAQSAGLLSQEQIEHWLREELDRQRKQEQLFNNLDRLNALEPPLSQGEIDAEIQTYREERKSDHQGDAS